APCICQAVIFRSFQSFLCNFNHLRFEELGVSRQREANSTALQLAVNCLFTAVDSNRRTEALQA
ncbi:hypothetical protein ABQX22_13185, partial [Xanthomonas sp. WHRI 1810A]|uniref:hypothetical protein n=1 Tax=Xanthomonas sp. WHRI 1810A TaxID=3161565 RepID=UPI0032E8D28B